MSLEEEFTEALEGTIASAKKRGYIPTFATVHRKPFAANFAN